MNKLKRFLLVFLLSIFSTLFASNNQFSLISYYYNQAGKTIISQSNADIICLQNVDPINIDEYTFYSDAKSKIATGYKTESFSYIDIHTRNFKTPGAQSNKYMALYLEHKTSSQTIGVINTNVHSKHTSGSYKDYIASQLQEITNYISENQIIKDTSINNWIICGNFNIGFKNNNDYQSFIKSTLANWTDIVPGAYNNQPTTLSEVKIKGKKTQIAQRFDYIFYKGNLSKQSYTSSKLKLDVGQHQALKAVFNLPSKKIPSDDESSSSDDDEEPQDIQFTITSCNVLYEKPYLYGLNYVDLSTRTKNFSDAFSNKQAFSNADILCFQEWPYESFSWSGKTVDQTTWNNEIPLRYNTIGMPSSSAFNWGHGPLVAYDKKKLKAKESFAITLPPQNNQYKNWALGVIFTLAANFNLGVVSAHLPWPTPKQALKKIVSTIKNKNADHWIICGDFNWEAKNTKIVDDRDVTNKNGYEEIREILSKEVWSDTDKLAEKTDGKNYVFTARNVNNADIEEKIDYMFYTVSTNKGIALRLETSSVYPTTLTDFLPHKPKNQTITGNYFSDHGILHATFKLEKESQEKQNLLKNALFKLKEKLKSLAAKLKEKTSSLKQISNGITLSNAYTNLNNDEIYIALVEGDITKQQFIDNKHAAIVNAANSGLWGAAGIAKYVQIAAGGTVGSSNNQLRKEIDNSFQTSPKCPTGEVRLTSGQKLDPLRILHAVGPSLQSSGNPTNQEKAELQSAFTWCLKIPDEFNKGILNKKYMSKKTGTNNNALQAVALVALSSGIFGYYSNLSATPAVEAVFSYLKQNQKTTLKEIRFVTYGGYQNHNDYANYKNAIEKQTMLKLTKVNNVPVELKLKTNDNSKPVILWKATLK